MGEAERSPLLDMLRAKAMLLVRREREVFDLRQQRSRIQLWLGVFHRLSLDLQSKSPARLMDEWADLIVSELSYQVAVVYAGPAHALELELLASRSHVPPPARLQLDQHSSEFFNERPQGQHLRDVSQQADLVIAGQLGLASCFWLQLALRDQRVLLLCGFSPDAGQAINTHDFGHFGLFGNHLGALLENITLIGELSRERSELSQSNEQLDRSLKNLRDAQSKLVQSTQSLAQVSRRAGMADIATGVLHNVGNTLNSVNIAAELACEHLRAMRLSGVQRVSDLLEQNQHDLPGFFQRDARGKSLGPYLKELAAHVLREGATVERELGSLREHIEHIKSIVSKQQAYAKTVGMVEPSRASDLMEDAIGLTVDSLSQLGVEVVREYRELPLLLLDRHKVLQILVNLMSNAKHALADSGSAKKRLRAFIEPLPENRLLFGVEDNGVGVHPSHMSQLFTHGFTTKKNGHGFGLHTSALAANEMGGCLRCFSAGLGSGATFTLELPAQPAPRKEFDS